MANNIAIVGQSSTGKSHSTKNLDPKETFIINVLAKPLPFKGSKSKYNKDKKNTVISSSHTEIIKIMKAISEKHTHIKNLILDDAGFVMSKELFQRANEAGYNKFTDIGQHFQMILETATTLRDDLNVVFMFHEDKEMVDGYLPQRKIKTIGRMLDDKYDPQAVFTTVLYTHVEQNKDNKAEYKFVTNRTKDYPAKSPEGMFDNLYIDNDLSQILEKVNSYYND